MEWFRCRPRTSSVNPKPWLYFEARLDDARLIAEIAAQSKRIDLEPIPQRPRGLNQVNAVALPELLRPVTVYALLQFGSVA